MKVDFIIDGASVGAANGATYKRHDPVTGKVASEAAAASAADVDKVVEAAARAFPSWSETGPSQRRALLNKAADLLESRTAEFSQLMTDEIGATGPWGGFNCFFAATLLREAAALTTQITGEVIPADKPGVLSMAMRQPVGVVLGMAPWNAPVILGVRAIAAPLACGNTVILRSSEVCPATHRLIVQTLNDAGFPKGVVNVIANAPEDAPKVVAALIAHPAVKRINFTGSSRVGKIIAKLAAEHLKPVLLELGGKAPLIVLDDADLDAAVDAAIFGAFANQGQICMSTERLIVDEKVADAFVAKLAKRAAALPAGDPRGPVVLGALVSVEAAERMDELIADAVAKGAKVVAGGKRTGAIVEATVVDHVKPGMRMYGEEFVRAGQAGDPRQGPGGGDPGRQRHRIRPVVGGVQPRRPARAGGRQAARNRHLPHQRPDRARRRPDAVRRRQGLGLRPVRRQGGDRRIHRAALDHHRRSAALSVLTNGDRGADVATSARRVAFRAISGRRPVTVDGRRRASGIDPSQCGRRPAANNAA